MSQFKSEHMQKEWEIGNRPMIERTISDDPKLVITVKRGPHNAVLPIAYVDTWGGEPMKTDFANAKLIAAAPDLLEACEEARFYLLGGLRNLSDSGHEALNLLDSAIAKAKGESNA